MSPRCYNGAVAPPDALDPSRPEVVSVERARAAASAALFAILLAATVVLAAAAPRLREAALAPAAAVGWPPSTLVVSEVQTGGATASDEFAEIANVGIASVDLAGLEIAYVTSTGGTVTKKAAWTTPTILEPGRHLLLANTSGAYASIADATYSGGFAAAGGAIVLRVTGGAPIDAVGWGDATNAFIEGAPAPASAAGSSLERRPGGLGGNTTDSNDNQADFFVQVTPNPQNLAAPPVPAPGPTATPTMSPTPVPTPEPTATVGPSATPVPNESATPDPTSSATPDPTPTTAPDPTASATPEPTSAPTPEPTTSPTPAPTPTSTPEPTPTPTPEPTPTPTPTPSPSPTPTPTPTPVALTIAEARILPDGSAAIIVGTLTTDLGALESARSGFVQDATAGIAVYLDAALAVALPAGSNVRLEGVIDERYGARTLRVAATAVMDLGPGAIPPAAAAETGVIGADLEGRRVVVIGLTSGSPTTFADGLGILVDDGTGPIRAIVGAEALAGAEIPAGTLVRVSGPVGQRDSSGTGTGGYRIHATEPGELEILPPPPTPTPPPTPEPTPDPTPTPTPEPSPAPSATSSPTPSISPTVAIAEARARAVGSIVTVIGVVTAEAGRIGTPPLFAIADATAGVLIRLPEGSSPPVRGGLIQVTGPLAAPFGQLEIRPGAGGMAHLGVDSPPAVLSILAADIGEGTEARLVTMSGRVTAAPRKSPSGDLAIEVTDVAGRTFRVMTDASSGLAATDLRLGQTYSLVGLVGQRASKKDALDGYRIWLRDRGDVTSIPEGPGGASPAPSAEGGSPAVMTLAEAAALTDAAATVEGVVTAGAGLLDAEGRRIVIQDATGGIEVLLGAGLAPPSAGARVRVEGIVGRAWGAPRLRASTVQILGTGPDVAPRILSGTPGESLEWQVVRIAGAISRVTRLGDRWRADVRVGGETILVTGLTGAGIASTSLVEGRAVTIVGIVRRPYPTATDRRWAILPRGPWDVAIGPAGSAAATASGAGNHIGAGGAGNESSGGAGAPGSHPAIRDVDIATLADHVGELVRVGGLVVAQTSDGFSLDDGTAIGAIVLRGDAAAFLDLIGAGEAIGIVGRVERRKDGLPAVIATDPAGLVRLGSLGETVPIAAGASASGAPSPTSRAVAVAGLGGPLDGPIGGWLGMSGLLVASAVSLFVAALRRRRVHLRLARVVAGRLAELKRSSGSA